MFIGGYQAGTYAANQSGRGQPHSKTLARCLAHYSVREVLECGCPLPLSAGFDDLSSLSNGAAARLA